MSINLTPIIQAIIALLAALITYKLIPWIKARTTAEQQSVMHAVVKTLVFAAEQLYGAKSGSEKLDWVIAQLQQKGYTVERAEIEAVVKEYTEALHVKKEDKTEVKSEEETQEKPPEV